MTPEEEAIARSDAATEAVERTFDSKVKRVISSFSLPSVLVRLGESRKFEVQGLALPAEFSTFALRTNAPRPGDFYITHLRTANVLATVGIPAKDWPAEGWAENPEEIFKQGQPSLITGIGDDEIPDRQCWCDAYDNHPFVLPTLTKTTPVTLRGVYAGGVPPGYAPGRDFMFTMTFFGNASLV
jgi:hypothetical protein